jgi:(E)-4-hydroxy-3-methylbut-2-enyl-diphosphate synthase
MKTIKRTNTKKVHVNNVQIGAQNRVIIQSMTNTPTKDVAATTAQILALEKVGCELVRVAVTDLKDAQAIALIKANITIPIIADIHFDYRLALASIASGVDKIRLNPGNLSNKDQVKEVVNAAKAKKIPIRIGINSGSLPKHLLKKYNGPCALAMLEAADEHISILKDLNFDDIILSFKSSEVPLTIEVYRLAAQTYPYPLHIGVTEAGTKFHSAIKSSAALGALLADGIGDTIRISISGDPVDEILVAKQLLNAFNLIDNVVNLVSCPTCGRLAYDMLPIVNEVEKYIATIEAKITVAVMGCAVNGPQEASRADIGIAGGKNEALLFSKGKLIKKVPQDQLLEALKTEIDNLVKTKVD